MRAARRDGQGHREKESIRCHETHDRNWTTDNHAASVSLGQPKDVGCAQVLLCVSSSVSCIFEVAVKWETDGTCSHVLPQHIHVVRRHCEVHSEHGYFRQKQEMQFVES